MNVYVLKKKQKVLECPLPKVYKSSGYSLSDIAVSQHSRQHTLRASNRSTHIRDEMACFNQQLHRSASTSSSCVDAAVQLLDHLENLCLCPDENLPVPYVLGRINKLLQDRLAVELRKEVNGTRGVADRSEEEKEDGQRQGTSLQQTQPRAAVTVSSSVRQQPPAQSQHRRLNGSRSSSWRPTEAATAPNKDTVKKFKRDLEEMNWHDGPLYVDIQFLWCERRGGNERGVVLKEVAVTCEGTDLVAWITVRPPKEAVPRRRANDYAIDVLHSVEWHHGDIDLDELQTSFVQLLRSERTVYVKGVDKENILVDILNVPRHLVVSLDELPRLEVLRRELSNKACPYHRNFSDTTNCAMRHVMVIKSSHSEGRPSTSNESFY